MDVLETILRWIVHAAIFRGLWALEPLAVVLVGAVCLVLWIGWRVVSRRRHRG